MPKITVITCTYNSELFIEQTLKSIYSQKFKDFEHIIIDNVSSDNTKKIIDNYYFKNRILISETDNGIYDAFNKGIQKSTGDIIGFLHSSDFYQNSDYLKNVVERFEKTNCDILYTSVLQFNSNNSDIKIKRKWKADSFEKFKLNYGWMLPHCSTFIKKKHYINNLYSTKYKISSDYNWLLNKLLEIETNKTQYLPEAYYMQRLDGISTDRRFFFKKFKEDYNILKEHYKFPILITMLKRLYKITQYILK
jgi:glycosyltransferase